MWRSVLREALQARGSGSRRCRPSVATRTLPQSFPRLLRHHNSGSELSDPLDVFWAVKSAVLKCEEGEAEHLRLGERLSTSFYFNANDQEDGSDDVDLFRRLDFVPERVPEPVELKHLYRRTKRLGKQGGGLDELEAAWETLRASSDGAAKNKQGGERSTASMSDADVLSLQTKQQAEACARMVSWVRNIVNPSSRASAEGKPPVKPQPLGLILSHSYNITALSDDSKAASNLKGSDALLYRTLVDAASVEGEAGLGGASVQVLPVVVAEQEKYYAKDHSGSVWYSELEATKKVFRFTREDFQRLSCGSTEASPLVVRRKTAAAGDATTDEAVAFPLPLDIPFVAALAGSHVVELNFLEDYGNVEIKGAGDWCSFEDTYFAGALVVVPRSYDGTKEVVVDGTDSDEEDEDDDDGDDSDEQGESSGDDEEETGSR